MKRLLALLLFGLLAVTCSKDDGSSKDDENIAPDKDLPQLPDSDDVCLDMNDIVFMKYCYNNFDSNKDGSLSTSEALAVRSIDLEGSNVNDLKGIEHFQNLESLNCKNCEKLQSMDISHNLKLTKIGNSAFEGCISLTNISIPDSVTEIGDSAFSVCVRLIDITIPENVTKIESQAFSECSHLSIVHCKPTTPPQLDSNAFYANDFGQIIYVPTESVSAYKSASGWSNYSFRIVGYDFQ